MTESSDAPSLANPLDVVPNDQTLGDVTAGDATRPLGEANAFTDEGGGSSNDDIELGSGAASDDLAYLEDGELVTDQEQSIDTPDELGGVGGPEAGGAG